jgi:hypothetical protein
MRKLWISLVVGFLWPAVALAQPTLCQGEPATIVGTELDDVLEGTEGPDVIEGAGGHDIIFGRKGSDVICAGAGDDIIYGNSGRDSIKGNGGHDLLLGGAGDDLLRGGKGDDALDGQGGTNLCKGGAGTNSLANCAAAPPPVPTGQPTPEPTPSQPGVQVPANFEGVVWLHTDVSSWAVTSPLSVSFGNGLIHLDYDKADVWPPNGEGLNGNPWVFVFQDGTWYAATWEWLRLGQTAKSMSSVAGDHIKKAPLQDFQPVSGQLYGFMVSGLARDAQRNVQERTPVVMVQWP